MSEIEGNPPPFDFFLPAELYVPAMVARRGHMDYRRFETAAAALLYALESLPGKRLAAAVLDVEGERYDAGQMKALYDRLDFPLERIGMSLEQPAGTLRSL